MTPLVLVVAALFALLFLIRLGGARRAQLARRWPALVIGGAAVLVLFKGRVAMAAMLGALAGLAWFAAPALIAPRGPAARPDRDDAEARALLGVGANASEADIRRAYRAKIVRAHPDRGGAHKDAALLSAARDRLLRKKS